MATCSSSCRKGPALPKPGRLRPGTGTAWQTAPSLEVGSHNFRTNWTNDRKCARDVARKCRSCTVAVAPAFFPLKPSGFRSFSLILFRACSRSQEQSPLSSRSFGNCLQIHIRHAHFREECHGRDLTVSLCRSALIGLWLMTTGPGLGRRPCREDRSPETASDGGPAPAATKGSIGVAHRSFSINLLGHRES